MLTDPLDNRVLAASQKFYAEALRKALLDAGFPEDRLDHREITADDPEHHRLRLPALLAASAAAVPEGSPANSELSTIYE
jgi:hypothetical protein